jgi:uncharacterized protein
VNTDHNVVPANRAGTAVTARDLSRQECLQALDGQTLGRLAVSQGALPLILPVNYALEGANIVFRTRAGSLLDRACRNTIVAFEIDQYDAAAESGWSVLVIGVANVVDAGEWFRALELGLISVGASDGGVFVKIVPGKMTGRAIGDDLLPPPADRDGR